MPQIIPLTNDSWQSETILGLDLTFYWNVRDSSWRVSISQNDTALINGVKLVMGVFLLRPYALGIGDFLVFENDFQLSDPTRDGFSTGQYELTYFTQEEVDELSALR